MDLIIRNASLEEVTALCYRIGEPNFQEQVESERKFGVVEYLVNQGSNLSEAEKTYDQTVEKAKTNVAIDSGNFEEASKPEEIEQPQQEQFHLDNPPEQPKEPVVNLKENLHQLATKLVQEKGSSLLMEILNGFGVKSLPELNESHYEAAIQKIKEVL